MTEIVIAWVIAGAAIVVMYIGTRDRPDRFDDVDELARRSRRRRRP